MKSIRSLVATLLTISLVTGAACSPQPPLPTGEPEAPSGTPEAPASPEPRDLTLRVGTTRDFKTTNKFADYWYGVLSNITTHDSLIKLGPDMQPAPWLARDWTISDDSTAFTFTIAENATWHDGAPLTPRDVQFSIEYYRDRDPQAGWMQEIIESISVDGNDVVLKLTQPYGNLLTEFMTYSIVPEHIWADVEKPLEYEGADRVIGSGPFTFVSWDPAAGRYIFDANEDYFQGSLAIDRIEFHVYRTMDALVMALARGEVDTWWDYSGEFPYTHVPPLLTSGDIQFATATFLGVPAALGFNLDKGPTAEIGFREAVTLAINYRQIADLVYAGYGSVPTCGFVPPTHPHFDRDVPQLTYDVEKAASLLDSLGYVDGSGDGLRQDSGGETLTLTLLTRGDMPSMLRVTEMVAADLRAVGIDTNVRALDSSTWVAAKDAMDYDLVFFRATPWGTMMHASHGSGYFDSRRTGAGVLHNLDAREYLDVCDARLSTAIAEEQKRLDRQLQQMHCEYLPGIALVWIESVYPYREGWDNWTIDHIYGGVVNSFSWFSLTRD